MDLTTLLAAIAVAFGLLTFETIRTADRVIVDVAELPRIDRTSIDQVTVEQEFAAQLNNVASVVSVIVPPEIRTQREVGVGKAIGAALKINDLALALESDLGYSPDRVRLALMTDNGALHAVVSGRGRKFGAFREVLTPREDERLLQFVRRCSLVGAGHLAPYGTMVFLVQEGARTGNLQPAKMVSARVRAIIPDTPVSIDRSRFENMDGIIALLEGEQGQARALFEKALASDPSNPVAALNVAFEEIQVDEYAAADRRMAALIANAPPENPILLSSAYMTRAAALLGMKRPGEAEPMAARAVAVNPDNSSALQLWGDVKMALGETAAAEALMRAARQTNDSLENYAEVATLYFQLSWREGTSLVTSPFSNPTQGKR